MQNKRIVIPILFLIGLVSLVFFLLINSDKSNDFTFTNEQSSDDSEYTTVDTAFEELGITLTVPKELDIIKNPIYVDPSSDALENYTFYIQNYVGNGAEIGFQLYGLMQFSIPTLTIEQFDEIKNDTETYEYIKELDINGLHGYETKLKGERNNYVYVFFLDGRTLRIAVSPGTKDSKEIADKIINSMILN